MKHILLFMAISFGSGLLAQKNEVEAKLKEYGIAQDVLEHGLKDTNAKYAFKLKTTTTTKTSTGETTETEECHFDPTQPVGSKWILDVHNGKNPNKKALKNFDKAHNTKEQQIDGKVSDDSWKIVTDEASSFVVSFQYDKETLPKKFYYLANCTATAYFNKSTKSLEKIEFVNNGDLHIKFFKVSKLDLVINYHKVDDQFLMDDMTADMMVEILGQTVPVHEESIYSDYKKVL